ncbi:MAG: hypothetical protein FJ293_04560 [Planctomycetes bacterium]|nr:hypothetical protein [Planctomycetota bacterium]
MNGQRVAARLCALLLVTAAATLGGCDQEWVDSRCEKVVFHSAAHAFTAERTVRTDPIDPASAELPVEWTERIQSDGTGQIAVTLLTRNGRTREEIADPAALGAFDRLAAQLATGGGHRAFFQRDPAPDDLDRMVANYWVTIVGLVRKPITSRGEPALTYLIEPLAADRPSYLLTASTKSGREGFPLACEEHITLADGSSRCVSRMEVTSLVWGAPSGFVPNPQPIVKRTALASLEAARVRAAAAGLDLLLPRDDALPPGFELIIAEEVVMTSTANLARVERPVTLWRFVYSDGIEHIDFIEHGPPETMPREFADNDLFEVAFVSRFGSIASASLLHRGTQITVESRISTERFTGLLQSLVRL